MAGGTGTRLGAGIPKQMVQLFGRPVLAHTLDRFLAFDPDIVLCAVLHPSLFAGWDDFLNTYFPSYSKEQVFACTGGAERTQSVYQGLLTLKENGFPGKGLVAIHDGVRPFVNDQILNEGFQLAAEKGNAVAGVPVKSSLRMLTEEGSKAIDRSQFFHVQTPQIFHLEEIMSCYQEKMDSGRFTDDASVMEACGTPIHLFQGSYDNIKITTPEDLALAERLLVRLHQYQPE